MKKLNHPNLVKLYAASSFNPYYLVMEYAKYGSLSDFLTKQDDIKLAYNKLISLAADIANGILNRIAIYIN